MSEINRALASVRRIADIEPIPGADVIVCATIDGWKLVTQKSNNFQIGDLVVYFEIDSFLPVCEKFEFLRKSSFKMMGTEEGFRLKTIRLKGQVSQGLILPLSEFFFLNSEGQPAWPDGEAVTEGTDLTYYIGIKKWDPPLAGNLSGKARGNFPSWLVKTDQERIQNTFKYKNRHKGQHYEASIKLDGSSMSVYVKDGYAGVCSRNLDLDSSDEGNLFWRTAKSTGLVEALEHDWEFAHLNYALQGELMGPGVQGNREQLKEHHFYVFDIFDIDAADYVTPEVRNRIINVLNGHGAKIDHVPVIGIVCMDDFETVQDFLDYADAQKSINHPIAEGVVFKSVDGSRNSFKVISNKFLLKEKD